MDHSTVVRCRQRPRDLQREFDGLALRQRPFAQSFAQRLALQQLGDDVGRTIVRADIVNDEYVGMVQCAGGARLLLESPQPVRVAGKSGGQHLDRDLALQPRIACAIDFAHSARADLPQDFIRTDARAGGRCHVTFETSLHC